MAIRRLRGEGDEHSGVYYEFDTESDILGEGGMGRVYLGKRIDRNGNVTQVAIKAMFEGLPDLVIQRARREASIQIRNDSLVRMYGFVESEDKDEFGANVTHYHVISEYLEGVSLEDIIVGHLADKKGVIHPAIDKFYKEFVADRAQKATEIIKAVLSGVMALHDSGFIHRDIDPSNIMVTTDGKIKLIDFGIAKMTMKLSTADKGLTSAGQFMGKAAYASPELVLGDVRHQNYSTDVYAIGILYFYLLTGHLPFSGSAYDLIEAQLKKKMPLRQIKSSQISEVIRKATEKKQSDRYSTASQMRAAIDSFKFPEAWYRNKNLKTAIAVVIGILVVAIAIFGVMKFVHKPEKVVDDTPDADTLYARALPLLNSSLPQEAQEGATLMGKLAEHDYAPAVYQLALTFAWAPNDSMAVSRKRILDVETDDLGYPKNKVHNEAAVDLLRKYLRLTDHPQVKAYYLLGCYYLNGYVVSRDLDEAENLFEQGLEKAQEVNDENLAGLYRETIRYVKDKRAKLERNNDK